MRLNPQTNSSFDTSDHIRHEPEAHDPPDNDTCALMSTSQPPSHDDGPDQFAGDEGSALLSRIPNGGRSALRER